MVTRWALAFCSLVFLGRFYVRLAASGHAVRQASLSFIMVFFCVSPDSDADFWCLIVFPSFRTAMGRWLAKGGRGGLHLDDIHMPEAYTGLGI